MITKKKKKKSYHKVILSQKGVHPRKEYPRGFLSRQQGGPWACEGKWVCECAHVAVDMCVYVCMFLSLLD